MLSIASKIVSVRQIGNEIQVRLLKDHFFINDKKTLDACIVWPIGVAQRR